MSGIRILTRIAPSSLSLSRPCKKNNHRHPSAERFQKLKVILLSRTRRIGRGTVYIVKALDFHLSEHGFASGSHARVATLAAAVPGRPSVRSSSRGDFIVPRTSRKFGHRAFSVAVSRAMEQNANGTYTLTFHATVQVQA